MAAPAPEEVAFLEASEADVFFVLVSGYLVFFMQCGFAMLSAGSVRAKNVKNILLKNLLDACFGAIGFYLTGYGFAYGENKGKDIEKFIGVNLFTLNGMPISDYHSFFFQYAFAATAATIVSGAVAERCKFEAYLLYALFLTMWVYPVVVHWVWAGAGWASAFNEADPLFKVGAIDFAGCGVVHMTGGLAAFAGALVLGPRIGRYDSAGKASDIPGHSTALAILGVFILWFGWFGFNPGSALAISGYSAVASLCAVTTTLAAAGGTISCLTLSTAVSYFQTGHTKYDLILASNGALGGLVAITSGTSVVHAWAAIFLGIAGGVNYYLASYLMANIIKVDDPLDAVAVHGFCGALGLLGAALLYDDDLYSAAYSDAAIGKRGAQLAANFVLMLAIIGWVLGHMLPFFYLTKVAGLFRVDKEEEIEGLDTSHHEGSAYPADTVPTMPSKV